MWYLYIMEFYSVTNTHTHTHTHTHNEILLFALKWMELMTIILSVIRFIRPKATCSPSYADYRPKTNTPILWGMGYTKGRPHTGGIGQWKESKNLNVVNVLTIQE
jgi:hypothetical protein